jgi:hypothetical protein
MPLDATAPQIKRAYRKVCCRALQHRLDKG